MKELFNKISNVCKLIFGYGIMATLFIGGLTFVGYIIALIIGGNAAANICNFIYKTILPITIYITTSTVLLGLISMYLAGEKSLTADKNKSVKENKK